jgi:hypothetical protein
MVSLTPRYWRSQPASAIQAAPAAAAGRQQQHHRACPAPCRQRQHIGQRWRRPARPAPARLRRRSPSARRAPAAPRTARSASAARRAAACSATRRHHRRRPGTAAPRPPADRVEPDPPNQHEQHRTGPASATRPAMAPAETGPIEQPEEPAFRAWDRFSGRGRTLPARKVLTDRRQSTGGQPSRSRLRSGSSCLRARCRSA